jgi:pimeloyl-ACP methyl ester carboxylesterase
MRSSGSSERRRAVGIPRSSGIAAFVICWIAIGVLTPGLLRTALPALADSPQLSGLPIAALATTDAIAGPTRVHPGIDGQVDGIYVHIPAGAKEPLTVLVALHGMGANGEDFARDLTQRSDAEGWVLVAPTYDYGDWRSPSQLVREASGNMPRLAAFLDQLPEITGLNVSREVLLYGFSRGGQAANRFALAYPERVRAAALVGPGTYTLPLTSVALGPEHVSPQFPFGVANLPEVVGRTFDPVQFARVSFWIGIGERDANPDDVPHEWDRYIGDDRLERAGRFAGWVREAGCNVQVQVFPGVGHGETNEIRTSALDFLARAVRSDEGNPRAESRRLGQVTSVSH